MKPCELAKDDALYFHKNIFYLTKTRVKKNVTGT